METEMPESAARLPPIYTNRYLCPITGCEWYHDEHVGSDGPWVPWRGSIEETVLATCMAQARIVGQAITDHAATHPVLEWFREVRSQQDRAEKAEAEVERLRAQAAADVRAVDATLKVWALTDRTKLSDALLVLREAFIGRTTEAEVSERHAFECARNAEAGSQSKAGAGDA